MPDSSKTYDALADMYTKHFVEYSPSYIYIKNPQGGIEYVNPACKRFILRKTSKIEDATAYDFFPPEYAALVEEQDQEVLTKQCTSKRDAPVVIDDEVEWLSILKFPLSGPNNEPLIGCITQNITARVKIMNELVSAREAADASNRAKSTFLANMSHELRTPLNGIMGAHQLLETTNLTHDQADLLEMATSSSRRLGLLLEDILDITLIESGKISIAEKPFRISETFQEIQELYSLACQQKNMGLEVNLDNSIPDILLGDSIRLHQVVNNLIGNSIKYSEEGTIQCKVDRLTSFTPDSTRILISISDEGRGIPDDKIGMIFEPFTQMETGFTRSHQGAGIGLSIVNRLVALMDGTISVESEEGSGTTIHVCLSFLNTGRPAASPTEQTPIGSTLLQNKTILVVEDDEVNRLTTVMILLQCGYTVYSAETGKTAIQMITKDSYDLIFMDIQMPEMDGIEATKFIRSGFAGSQNKDVPIVALTAYASPDDADTILAAGVDAYISKPAQKETLVNWVNKLLG